MTGESELRPRSCAQVSLVLAGVNLTLVGLIALITYLIIARPARGEGPFAGFGMAIPLLATHYCGAALFLTIAVVGTWYAVLGLRRSRRIGHATLITRNTVALLLHTAPPALFILYEAVAILLFWIRGWWPF